MNIKWQYGYAINMWAYWYDKSMWSISIAQIPLFTDKFIEHIKNKLHLTVDVNANNNLGLTNMLIIGGTKEQISNIHKICSTFLAQDTPYADMSLEEFIMNVHDDKY